MNKVELDEQQELIERALDAARDTEHLSVEHGVRHRVASTFSSIFGAQEASIIADENTYRACGRDVEASFVRENKTLRKSLIFGPDVCADDKYVRELVAALSTHAAIPVAVGSGTINDLTKAAAHQTKRPYMVVGTAASMDGYASFGASITISGSKNTLECPAPRAVLADLDVIAQAPAAMNAWGYGDLMAKVVAGADWVLADAAGIEPINTLAWETVQSSLRSWIGAPDEVAAGNPVALRNLVCGLVMSGFAMQATLSSRPASGAEHQFSHLWEMQRHTFHGESISHGFKVGIGALASLALYEELLGSDVRACNIEAAVSAWPSLDALEQRISKLFGPGALQKRAKEETRAKYVSGDTLRIQLKRIQENWEEVRSKLVAQLIPFDQLRNMLRLAGCPYDPGQIGISRSRLRLSYEQCCYMRRRFTVLDFMQRLGTLDSALDDLFGPHGRWSAQPEQL